MNSFHFIYLSALSHSRKAIYIIVNPNCLIKSSQVQNVNFIIAQI